MQISAAHSWIWQQDSQIHSLFDAVETGSLTVVEADDYRNQRSVNYFSTVFIKNKQINKKRLCGLQIQTSFSNG